MREKTKKQMIPIRKTGVLLAILTLALKAHAAFDGDFAPTYWTTSVEDGSVTINSSTITILGPANQAAGSSVDAAIYLGPGGGGIPTAGFVTFNWTLTAPVFGADASFAATGLPTTTFATSPGSGTFVSDFMAAGSQFSISLFTSDSAVGKEGPELQISNFSFVPEASTLWAGGVLALGFGFSVLRQLGRQKVQSFFCFGRLFGALIALGLLGLATPARAINIGGVEMGNLPNYLFVFTDGSVDANWQGATKGFVGDVAVSSTAATRTSGSVPYAGTIYTDGSSLGAWQNIVNQNAGQAFESLNQVARLAGLKQDLSNAFHQINLLPATAGFTSVSASSLNGLNTSNGVAETFVINITSGFQVSSKINITGDAGDVFILRWDADANPANGYQGQVKFQSGGAIVPLGGLKPSNFINVAGDIDSSGGDGNPPPPYPQGPRLDGGTGPLINGGSDFSGGGFFTGYWLTTGDPATGETHSLSNGIFVGGWYTSTTKFSMTSGTSGVYVPPNVPGEEFFSVGNRVWLDTGPGAFYEDGIQDDAEPGIANVQVQLLTSSNTVVKTTTTDSLGYYRFDNVPAGSNYTVFIPAANFGTGGALNGLVSSSNVFPTLPTTTSQDQHNKGSNVVGGVISGPFDLGPGLQPLNEPDTNGTPASVHGPTGDTNDNLTIDFGFVGQPTAVFSVGNRVWLDMGPGTNFNDGIQDDAEGGISGVLVQLLDNVGAIKAVTTTDASGYYRFDGLPAGSNYTVLIPASNFDPGGPLNGLLSSSNVFPMTPFSDQTNKGSNVVNGVSSGPFDLGPGQQPLNEPDTNGTPASLHGPFGDTNDNLTVDFGFYQPEVPTTFSVGNRVWLDFVAGGGANNNDGIQEPGEPGIANVVVQLLDAFSNAVASVTTDAEGYYRFDSLPAGTYRVFIPSDNFAAGGPLNGLISSPLFPITDPDQHNKGSGATPTVNGVISGPFALGPSLQPLNEPDTNGTPASVHGPTGDANDNLTIDFGFSMSPSLALLKSITAVVVNGSVYVGWETASEEGTLAFDLFRVEGTSQVPVGQALANNSPTGGTYSLPDPGVSLPGTYTYILYEETQQGTVNLIGTYELTVSGANQGSDSKQPLRQAKGSKGQEKAPKGHGKGTGKR